MVMHVPERLQAEADGDGHDTRPSRVLPDSAKQCRVDGLCVRVFVGGGGEGAGWGSLHSHQKLPTWQRPLTSF